MPNTLAHIAVHMPLTRFAVRKADARWILLGCVISDLPWISQRVVRFVLPGINPYDLRLYCLVQASLLVSLLLAGAFAVLSTKPWRTFLILSMGVAMHLLLDATQHKWGNAVHMLAPFSWASLNFDLFWPEHWATYALTALGVAGFVLALRGPWEHPLLAPRRWAPAALLLAAYLAVPFLWMDAAERSGTHSINVLRDIETRAGRRVAIDRGHFAPGFLTTFAGEELRLVGRIHGAPAFVSVRGVFIDDKTLRVENLHVHRFKRNWASYVGLALVAAAWLRPVLRRRRLG